MKDYLLLLVAEMYMCSSFLENIIVNNIYFYCKFDGKKFERMKDSVYIVHI